MAVVIRLTKMGRKGEAKYRVVVAEKRSRRDGKPIESLGWLEKTVSGAKKDINRERYKYWLSKGAMPSQTVANLLK
jgi:small subunit ribosomal protein S16